MVWSIILTAINNCFYLLSEKLMFYFSPGALITFITIGWVVTQLGINLSSDTTKGYDIFDTLKESAAFYGPKLFPLRIRYKKLKEQFYEMQHLKELTKILQVTGTLFVISGVFWLIAGFYAKHLDTWAKIIKADMGMFFYNLCFIITAITYLVFTIAFLVWKINGPRKKFSDYYDIMKHRFLAYIWYPFWSPSSSKLNNE